jgi:hypothetical protein
MTLAGERGGDSKVNICKRQKSGNDALMIEEFELIPRHPTRGQGKKAVAGKVGPDVVKPVMAGPQGRTEATDRQIILPAQMDHEMQPVHMPGDPFGKARNLVGTVKPT